MTQTSAKPRQLAEVDPVWHTVRSEAERIVAQEPAMAGFIYAAILNHDSLESAVSGRISERMNHSAFGGDQIQKAFSEMYADKRDVSHTLRADLVAVYDRDPACDRMIEPVLYFKGFHALQAQRLGHWLYSNGRPEFALYLQSRISDVFQVDIHPRVPIGKGAFIDHATGVVIGSTAVIEEDVSILQNVTLGGTGKESGDRHPKIRRGVLIGAGANILGNIEIGECSRVAAGSVVLKPVPPRTTVAGVPARVVGKAGCSQPSRTMDQLLATVTEDTPLDDFPGQ